jgi:hypothetical protein
MAQISITATASELLQLSKALKFSLADKPDNRSYTVTIDNAPGAGSTWAVTDPGGKVRKG